MHFDTQRISSATEWSDTGEALAIGGPDLISDDDIDYADIARRTQADQPGGRVVFDSADYPTHEEAMAALEALFLHDMTRPDDEIASEG